ncbi:light-regulated protein, chloroplastic [Ricinus communis]|uniref:Light-regulated protein, putative n=1 Tax=Ricinus communis TaxID=3988 RepID=B9RFZ2_RICCO|nr:light-regulated protein, chloroplastic [Ricinus communis]EEF50113.1 Light-regulated protein precursor, putative [Ricinus communis]|eukprot:XP_002512661.1 light-regulated protein, chloroplastic [Ricinus communis]
MQAALHLPPPPLSIVRSATALPWRSIQKFNTTRCSPIRASTPVGNDTSTVDYSSVVSVFPAEACETIGGEVCDVDMYPEVKLKPEAESTTAASTATEHIDREYLQYDSPKTVFLEEACDDLGGEFCDPEYQRP